MVNKKVKKKCADVTMITCVDRKEVFKYIDNFTSELINFHPNTKEEAIAKASVINTLSIIEDRIFSMDEIYVDLERNIAKRIVKLL